MPLRAIRTSRPALIVLVVVTAGASSSVQAQAVRLTTSSEPRLLKHVAPRYPEAAWNAGLEGVVVVDCAVDAEGKVSGTKVHEGVPPLVDAVVAAVKKWRYRPTLQDGKPTSVNARVTITFKHPGEFVMADLKASLEHRDEFIREAAALSLGQFGPGASSATTLLMRVSQDKSARVRAAASDALRKVRGEP